VAWLRFTDTFATHPIVLAVLEHPEADDRSVNEIAGFITRCSTQAGLHYTDYVFTFATAVTMAGNNKAAAERLLLQAEFAGYGVNEIDEATGRRRFRLVDDPEFIHMITAEQKAWEQQRKADNANTDITAPVRCRDGDVCRYCYNVVNFDARKGKLRGTYDHRPPGQPGSVETSVVACGECNSRRGNQPVEVADLELPLLPPLPEPYYRPATRSWLQGYAQVLRRNGMTPPPPAPDDKPLAAGRPAPGAKQALAALHATDEPAPQAAADTAPRPGVRPAAPQAATQAAPTGPATSSATAASAVPADPSRSQQKPGLQDLDSSGRVGTGRDGSSYGSTGGGSPAAHLSRPPASAVPAASPAPGSTHQPQQTSSASPRRRRRGKRGGSRPTSGGSRA
jgi:hypothetical protein